ncbi:NADH-quinone oxidoreductase subunit C [Streptomyces sp. NBC_00053]|uniref:NADH-quinone oxidoreductase subunit C n=1 Tax=unclassified Streptomyces TaxID=2593676 RepID=UPI00225049C3|nr:MULTISPECIES: NADH-quinone oxidoreductase subunit C [unclassified Streptomyces]MCX5502472.1 NADH-quinone oxidoreductase subunit C [Streptomyces sp. NBC_00052]MCX5548992.1 NADH-quinone oxidoreductase subunit C [Streptomyces sp. NBC_00051]
MTTPPTPDEAPEAYDRLPDAAAELFGDDATAEYAYDLLTVDVPAASWIAALETARDRLGCTYFDWLSAVDEPGTGFRVCAHVAALAEGRVRRLLVRTTVPHEAAVLPTAIDVYAGAAWHERETHEMFGIGFEGHPHLVPLLLPEGFEGHPLRKDFVLAARVAKAWPGAKEPGESEHGGPKRRTMLPPGVPDPNEWGPLKGQLPPAPSRPTRTPRAAGDRPARRTRSASEGSAAQRTAATAAGAGTGTDAGAGVSSGAGTGTGAGVSSGTGVGPGSHPGPATPGPTAPRSSTPRRTRSASEGSASQQRARAEAEPGTETGAVTGAGPGAGTESRTAPGTESGAAAGTQPGARTATGPRAGERTEPGPGTGTRPGPQPGAGAGAGAEQSSPEAATSDAPWHHARPAFDADSSEPLTDTSQPLTGTSEPLTDSSEPVPGTSQPLRRLRSGGPGAEPPVREGAGRGEAPRSGTPTPDTETDTTPDTGTTPEPEPAPSKTPETAESPETPETPAPNNHPAGGDTA